MKKIFILYYKNPNNILNRSLESEYKSLQENLTKEKENTIIFNLQPENESEQYLSLKSPEKALEQVNRINSMEKIEIHIIFLTQIDVPKIPENFLNILGLEAKSHQIRALFFKATLIQKLDFLNNFIRSANLSCVEFQIGSASVDKIIGIRNINFSLLHTEFCTCLDSLSVKKKLTAISFTHIDNALMKESSRNHNLQIYLNISKIIKNNSNLIEIHFPRYLHVTKTGIQKIIDAFKDTTEESKQKLITLSLVQNDLLQNYFVQNFQQYTNLRFYSGEKHLSQSINMLMFYQYINKSQVIQFNFNFMKKIQTNRLFYEYEIRKIYAKFTIPEEIQDKIKQFLYHKPVSQHTQYSEISLLFGLPFFHFEKFLTPLKKSTNLFNSFSKDWYTKETDKMLKKYSFENRTPESLCVRIKKNDIIVGKYCDFLKKEYQKVTEIDGVLETLPKHDKTSLFKFLCSLERFKKNNELEIKQIQQKLQKQKTTLVQQIKEQECNHTLYFNYKPKPNFQKIVLPGTSPETFENLIFTETREFHKHIESLGNLFKEKQQKMTQCGLTKEKLQSQLKPVESQLNNIADLLGEKNLSPNQTPSTQEPPTKRQKTSL